MRYYIIATLLCVAWFTYLLSGQFERDLNALQVRSTLARGLVSAALGIGTGLQAGRLIVRGVRMRRARFE